MHVMQNQRSQARGTVASVHRHQPSVHHFHPQTSQPSVASPDGRRRFDTKSVRRQRASNLATTGGRTTFKATSYNNRYSERPVMNTSPALCFGIVSCNVQANNSRTQRPRNAVLSSTKHTCSFSAVCRETQSTTHLNSQLTTDKYHIYTLQSLTEETFSPFCFKDIRAGELLTSHCSAWDEDHGCWQKALTGWQLLTSPKHQRGPEFSRLCSN